jgi:hypothetical protein
MKEADDMTVETIIGKEIGWLKFFHTVSDLKGWKYSIATGYNSRDILAQNENTICSGIITGVTYWDAHHHLTIEIDGVVSETFSFNSIKTITANENKVYVIYNDGSYFKITFTPTLF